MDFRFEELAELADNWREDAVCSRKSLLLFTRQFATLVNSGLSILPCLEALAEQEEPKFGLVVKDLRYQISSGRYISQSLATFPNIFPSSYVAMIKVAESTGGLAEALKMIGNWLEHENQVLQKVKAALTYPVLVLICAFLMTTYLFCKVMPGFVKIFEEIGSDLPLITVVLMAITKIATSPLLWVLIAISVFFLATEGRRLLGGLRGQIGLYKLMGSLPLISKCLTIVTMSKFCNTLSAMLEAGLPLQTVVRLACQSSGNPILREVARELVTDIGTGEPLSKSMQSHPELFPQMVCQVFAVGEETGQLSRLSSRLGEMYREDLENRLDQLTSLFEPVLLLGASLAVGTILLGIFLPLYSYLGKLGS